jgi:hypothetical protein
LRRRPTTPCHGEERSDEAIRSRAVLDRFAPLAMTNWDQCPRHPGLEPGSRAAAPLLPFRTGRVAAPSAMKIAPAAALAVTRLTPMSSVAVGAARL